jgi:hypothetical protein
MLPRTTTLRCLLLLFCGAMGTCLAMCIVGGAKLAPGYYELVDNQHIWPAVSYWMMDPATRMVSSFVASPAIAGYAMLLWVERPDANKWRIAGLICVATGASGVVTYADSVTSAETGGVEMSMHVICAGVLILGVGIVGLSSGARAYGTASIAFAALYAILNTTLHSPEYNAFAEYAAAITGVVALWIAAGGPPPVVECAV